MNLFQFLNLLYITLTRSDSGNTMQGTFRPMLPELAVTLYFDSPL